MKAYLLKSEIVKNGMTQCELAKKIGMSSNSLSRKISGQRDFRLTEVAKICEVLHIEDPTDIFLT